MKHKSKLYIAYGSNLNLDQMKHRCPTAEVVGTMMLGGWRLRFRGENQNAVATIEENDRFRVPTLVWRIRPRDERALDRYEGWPYLYRKEYFRIILEGEEAEAMIYIMNEDGHPYGEPSIGYLCTINAGYQSAGFDNHILLEAMKSSRRDSK